MNSKKKCMFFIDDMGGGGAERVVSIIITKCIDEGIDTSLVMLRKRKIAYSLPRQVHIIYANEIELSLYGRFIRKTSNKYKKIRKKILLFFRKKGLMKNIPDYEETSLYFYSNYALPYRRLLRRNHKTTAFGFLIRSNISLLMAARVIKVKTVFCERNNPIRPDMPKNIMKIRDRIYHRCSAAVFQTEEEMAYYTRIKGPKLVIPNPLKEGLPERYTGVRRYEIVNFCRLSKQKNIPLLIDAFEMLLRDHPDYTLRIYGEGPEKDSLNAYIKEKKLNEKAFIENFACDIHDRIRDAAMFVSTSDFEGLSNSMLEAMAIGLPSVCTDCDGGGARMMIQDHINGLLVPKGEVKALYHAIKEIIENKELAERLSKNAEKIKEELSVDHIVNEWIKMI